MRKAASTRTEVQLAAHQRPSALIPRHCHPPPAPLQPLATCHRAWLPRLPSRPKAVHTRCTTGLQVARGHLLHRQRVACRPSVPWRHLDVAVAADLPATTVAAASTPSTPSAPLAIGLLQGSVMLPDSTVPTIGALRAISFMLVAALLGDELRSATRLPQVVAILPHIPVAETDAGASPFIVPVLPSPKLAMHKRDATREVRARTELLLEAPALLSVDPDARRLQL
mmetsp:Transcript_64349/g.141860  ORF Transcript_64349/g.141860 Transcript_64349/m.141860 type:complete len:226 (+) Transcript_64349:1075-1752(+)